MGSVPAWSGEKKIHFHVSNLKEFSGEDRFKNVELLQQLFGTKIIFPCHVRLRGFEIVCIVFFQREVFF